MIFFDVGDEIVCVLRKNGSQSIRHACFKFLEIKELPVHIVAQSKKPIFTFIRHPIERLQSAFRYFFELGWPVGPGFNEYPVFVDAVLGGLKNVHWDSQVEQLIYGGRFLPSEVYKFDVMPAVWSAKGLPTLRKHNPSSPRQTGDYRREELEAFYDRDLKAFRAAAEVFKPRGTRGGDRVLL